MVGENGCYRLVFGVRDDGGTAVVGWVLGREVVGENGRCGMGFVE